MAGLDLLPRQPAMIYRPEEDIPMTNPTKINRYIKGIGSAIRRLDLLTHYLASEKYGSPSACIELGLSIKHHLQMFKDINMSIQDPNDKVQKNIDRIEKIEREISAIILFTNFPENGATVPSISPYELAIRVIIDNCIRAKQAKGAKDLMTQILAQLKTLYRGFGPTGSEDGAPRTITFCISGIKADEFSVSVATSQDVWMPGSFLQQWMLKTRASRFGEMGRQACRNLIDEVDQVVNFSNENVRVEVLRQVGNGYVARELRQLEAQAFNGKTFAERDRCWRCRLSFGFTWMSTEADPAKAAEEDVIDYEGRWNARPSEPGNLPVEVECGKCAEYLMWAELPPETIPLPEERFNTYDEDASHASALFLKNQDVLRLGARVGLGGPKDGPSTHSSRASQQVSRADN